MLQTLAGHGIENKSLWMLSALIASSCAALACSGQEPHHHCMSPATQWWSYMQEMRVTLGCATVTTLSEAVLPHVCTRVHVCSLRCHGVWA